MKQAKKMPVNTRNVTIKQFRVIAPMLSHVNPTRKDLDAAVLKMFNFPKRARLVYKLSYEE